jgi:hypothetical protein
LKAKKGRTKKAEDKKPSKIDKEIKSIENEAEDARIRIENLEEEINATENKKYC